MVRRSHLDLSKTAFIPLYCAIVRPPLGHAMETNSKNLIADINHLERNQRFARLLGGPHPMCHLNKGFVNSTSSHLNADASELTSFFKIFKESIPTGYCTSITPSAMKERCFFCVCHEILGQIADVSSRVTLSGTVNGSNSFLQHLS